MKLFEKTSTWSQAFVLAPMLAFLFLYCLPFVNPAAGASLPAATTSTPTATDQPTPTKLPTPTITTTLPVSPSQTPTFTPTPTPTATATATATPMITATSTKNPEVILEEPALTPLPQEVCDSGWYKIDNDRGHTAYLSLNADGTAPSTHSGVWQPVLPMDGTYRVEAYIPSHPAVDWPCPTKHISWDTASAQYTIFHSFGSSTVTRDQSHLNDQWSLLGEYAFQAGEHASVMLTDITGEPDQSTTVSFSAMRFSWLRPVPKSVYLPVINNAHNEISVEVTASWISDGQDSLRSAFVPGEEIRYHVTGTNVSINPVPATITWSRLDACGGSQVVSAPVNLASGGWNYYYAEILPDCLGVYTQSVQVAYQGQLVTLGTSFVVNNSSAIRVSDKAAFDRCYSPPIDWMQIWWNKSPYYDVNIYLGGVSFGCDPNPYLDAFWVSEVSRQGWSLIPTWVGLQAPCSNYRYRFSPNPGVAYTQGRQEADAAATAAAQLGLTGDRVIYYDLEGFTGASQSCRDAMKSFVKGWVERLHELGAQAGMYGSCNSYIQDWATVDPSPDDAWMAYWKKSFYDPNATVWGVPCVSDTLWSNHRRIRQYTGGHTETWGGVSMSIDSDIVDGEVTLLPQPTPPRDSQLENEQSVNPALELPIQSMQLVTPEQGWALVGSKLLWSEDAGLTWTDITPPQKGALPILSTYFLDSRRGWVLLAVDDTHLMVLQTPDGGHTWSISSRIDLPPEEGFYGQVISFSFTDALNGWISLQLPSGSSFSRGRLFATQDCGLTWKAFNPPVAGAVIFMDAVRGWLVGGVKGNDIYQTQDSGESWQAQPIPLPEGVDPASFGVGLPWFDDRAQAHLPVTFIDSSGSHLALYVDENGKGWRLEKNLPIPGEQAAAVLSLSAAGSGNSLSGSTDGNAWLSALFEGKSALSISELIDRLPGIVQIQYSGPQNGWARLENGTCSGEKKRPESASPAGSLPFSCWVQSSLVKTADGGQTWVEITPVN